MKLTKYFNFRIRKDRFNHTVIDRYILKPEQKFNPNPFENEFNSLVLKENYNDYTLEKTYNKSKLIVWFEFKIKDYHETFDENYYYFLKTQYENLPDITDEDSEEINPNHHDIKNLSQAYNKYLKNKRTNESTITSQN